MARDISAKTRAKRLDPTGYKHPSSLVRARPVAAWILSLVALAWVALAGLPGGSKQTLYMPGPLEAAHAALANDCTTCHDGGVKGSAPGFFNRAVSDAACIKCHAGPVHHLKQVDLRSGLSSASCTTCHIEHRGRPALSAAVDSTCTSCHADLTGKTLNPQPLVQSKVTAFGADTHPHFGRLLRGASGDWVDPTRLRFNHKLHFEQAGKPELKECSSCHATTPVSDPTRLPALGPLIRSYMMPVSYDRNCKSCHAITLPGAPSVPLAHDRLDVVRAQLDAMPAQIDRVVNGASSPPPASNDEAVSRVQQQLDQVIEAIRPLARDNKPAFEAITRFVRARAAGDAAAVKATTMETFFRGATVTQPHPKRVEWAVVFASEGRCTKCHDVRGEVVPGYVEPTRSQTPDPLAPYWETLPAGPGTALQTVPTGMPVTAPRRWFANARFDHRSHRSANCLDCHEAVQQSTKTSDVSLPDLTFRAGRPGAKSCVDCHHRGRGGIASTCVTCHVYHNSRLERNPVGTRGAWDAITAPQAPPAHPGEALEEPKPGPPPNPAAELDPSAQTPAPEAGTAPGGSAPTQPAPSDLPPPPDASSLPPPDRSSLQPNDLPPPPDAAPAPTPEKNVAPAPDLPPPPDAPAISRSHPAGVRTKSLCEPSEGSPVLFAERP